MLFNRKKELENHCLRYSIFSYLLINRGEFSVSLDISQVSSETSTHMEGSKRPKKEADHSRWVGGSLMSK